MLEPFLKLFSDPRPALRVKFRLTDEEFKTIPVQHRLGTTADTTSGDYLKSLSEDSRLIDFRNFYQEHDSLELCRTNNARYNCDRPLIEFKPIKNIQKFTSRYMAAGDRAWVMDLNKSKAIYRGPATWAVFAEIDSGPACLTIFLDGDNAGSIFYATPQPEFNILRPVAKDFEHLLNRIAKDLPAFLRLIRATVSVRGTDGHNYGFVAVEYLANCNGNVT